MESKPDDPKQKPARSPRVVKIRPEPKIVPVLTNQQIDQAVRLASADLEIDEKNYIG